ncbi:MAG: FliH/SctL family protein [Lachnospiraceae bacterium]
MYNFYKQCYGTKVDAPTRVIDSNRAVEEKLEELAKKLREETSQQGEGFVEGFTEGINAEKVEDILEDQKSLEEMTQEEADAILADARQQADALIASANQQKQQIEQQARKEGHSQGYADGHAEALQEMEQEKAELSEYKEQLDAQYQKQMEELEPQLVDVITQVFEKVFHVQFDDNKAILVHLIKKSMRKMEGCHEFNVRVSEDNYAFVEGHKQDILTKVGKDISLAITADPMLKENECLIDTDSGIFDCSLGIQLENLVKDIKCLSM